MINRMLREPDPFLIPIRRPTFVSVCGEEDPCAQILNRLVIAPENSEVLT